MNSPMPWGMRIWLKKPASISRATRSSTSPPSANAVSGSVGPINWRWNSAKRFWRGSNPNCGGQSISRRRRWVSAISAASARSVAIRVSTSAGGSPSAIAHACSTAQAWARGLWLAWARRWAMAAAGAMPMTCVPIQASAGMCTLTWVTLPPWRVAVMRMVSSPAGACVFIVNILCGRVAGRRIPPVVARSGVSVLWPEVAAACAARHGGYHGRASVSAPQAATVLESAA